MSRQVVCYLRVRASFTDLDVVAGLIQTGPSFATAVADADPVSNDPLSAITVACHVCVVVVQVTPAPPVPFTSIGVFPPFCC